MNTGRGRKQYVYDSATASKHICYAYGETVECYEEDIHGNPNVRVHLRQINMAEGAYNHRHAHGTAQRYRDR